MANSFNISVKLDIAAAVVKIDAIKADTGPIRNDVTAIHDTDLPAVKNDTGPVRNDVTAIHDTMLPAVKVDTGAIRNDVTDIHDTNLPLVKTDTGAIRNDVDDVKTIINAIKLKTDATPQSVRGKFYSSTLNTTAASYADVVNITGHGKLNILVTANNSAADTIRILITVDGTAFIYFEHTGDTTSYIIIPLTDPSIGATNRLQKIALVGADVNLFNLEFNTSLLVQIYRSAGTTSTVGCKVCYTLDAF